MTSEETIRQRASILGTQIISKVTAKRLGIVTQLWLDVDQRKVMGVTVAERFLPGTAISLGDTFYMSLERVSLLGPDAILVDDESVLEDILVAERYTSLISNEVVTESGELLGKVRDFKFDPMTGELVYLILSSLGSPLIPSALISTYELDVNEIIAVGRDRIIVTEGMEERLTQITKGVLERLGLGKPPWEQEFEDEYLPPTTISNNALGTGQRNNSYPSSNQQRTPLYRREEVWEEDDNWVEERTPVNPPPRSRQARVQPPVVSPPPVKPTYNDDYEDDYEDDDYYEDATKKEIKDAWSDESRLPEKSKQRQPEEELEEL